MLAQRKRAGLITRRTLDRNQDMLWEFFYFFIFVHANTSFFCHAGADAVRNIYSMIIFSLRLQDDIFFSQNVLFPVLARLLQSSFPALGGLADDPSVSKSSHIGHRLRTYIYEQRARSSANILLIALQIFIVFN